MYLLNFFDYLGIGLLGALLLVHIFKRAFLIKYQTYFFFGSLAIVFSALIAKTHYFFLALQHSAPPSVYLLPPYTSISYFLLSSWTHGWAIYLISLLIALIIYGLLRLLPKHLAERFFEPNERLLMATCIFLSGHPGWIAYLLFSILLFLGMSIFATVRKKESIRISFYHFWILIAIASILIAPFLNQIPYFTVLKLA